jgi:hypothetical protein
MESISFFFKSFLLAFVAIILMQVQVGGDTIENHILDFVHGSSIAHPIQLVADGGAKAIRTGWNYVSGWVNNNKPAISERASSMLHWERSEAYKKSEKSKSPSD